ncbi:sensor histidine kinase [Actinomadura hibisca]|uniref:sensor histidine kinase n=1 Tax=Actinomadura hibisca TaxID=68565 RepID=UPI001C3F4887|nr:histidine kinase [Actinomadura hibisca]
MRLFLLVTVLATAAAVLLRNWQATVPGWALPPVLAAVLLALLAARSARRGRDRDLAERSWSLERERQAAAEAARAAERAKVAADLHDIVAHNVSVMVVQAGAARFGLADGDAHEALRAVEDAGRGAMAELRTMLDLLAPAADGADGVEAPQAGLDRLGPLLDRVAFAGLPVEVTWSGERPPLPQGVDTAAYRVVQEALTNALKHAPGSRAEVHVRFTPRYVRVEVLNTGPSVLTGDPPPPAPGEGRGLAGLAERVAAYGGDLHARRRVGGGFRVRARIPVEGG